VTINAAKSKIPLVAKTPISILTREILQYASTTDEAIAIARKRKVFVSESIMVGSAKDKKAILIEVSPNSFGVFEVPNSNNQLLCTNHYQSDVLKDNKRNVYQIENSHSQYRYEKLQEDFNESPKISPQIAAGILRDREGLNGKAIGYGNERALNQLLAHHGVVFKPEQKLVWVSANPYQLGEFVCYDLNEVFDKRRENGPIVSLQSENLNIAKDPFLDSESYKNYELFRIEDRKMDVFLENKKGMSAEFLQNYQHLNPNYYKVYYKPALYFYKRKEYALARPEFEDALSKEITTLPERQAIEKYLKKIKRKLQ
jgi:hypothetical protein